MNPIFKKALLAAAVSCTLGANAFASTTADHNKEIIGYITNWDPWKDTNAGFPAKGVANHLNVDMSKFTVLNYSFFGVAKDGSLHSGDHRNKNIHQAGSVQEPNELLMSDIYSSWDYHLMFGELAPAHQLTDEATEQGFTVSGTTWTHEAYGLTGKFPIPVKKVGGKPGILDHAHANGVKVMASIGGWSMCKHFSEMAADPAKRANFIKDVRRLIAMGFDGIDIDWEYPGPFSGMNFTGTEADYGNFEQLMRDIRAEIGEDKLITAAFSADTRKLEGFDWVELDRTMDSFNMMTYDFNGGWANKAGHNAPVHDYPDSEVPFFNWDTLAQWMLGKGIDGQKINMGMPFYGRGVIVEDPADVNAPTIKRDITIQPDGPISTAADFDHWKSEVYDGTPNHFYIEQNKAGWTEHYDEDADVPYLTKNANGKSYFLSYDNEKSIGNKAQYVNDYSLGGAIVWTVVGDLQCTGGVTVHSGKLATCGNVNQPLANKINDVFANGCQGCPTIFFTSPGQGDSHAPGDDINLAVNATDADGTITQVAFSVNGQQLGVDSSAPYSFMWEDVPAGNHQVTAVATDNAGNIKETPAMTVSVNDDHISPIVEYQGPTGDITMSSLSAVTLEAKAQYAAGSITSVTFAVDGQTLNGSMTTKDQYTASYVPSAYGKQDVVVTATNNVNMSQTAMGSFNITLCTGEAWDPTKVYTNETVIYQEKQYTSKWWNQNATPGANDVWTFIQDCGGSTNPSNTPPTVSNVQPSGTSFEINSIVALSTNASDADGTVTSVQFSVNGRAVGAADTSAPYTVDYDAGTAGTHSLNVVATDDDGAMTEVATTFTVTDVAAGKAPVVTIENPGSGMEYDEGSIVSLMASASDEDGSIANMTFTLDGTVIVDNGSASSSYDYTAVVGNHTLVVEATDNDNNKGSQSVSFTVKSVVTPGCVADAWSASTAYNGGARVSVGGQVYQAKWWTQGEDPANGTNDWYVWQIPADCK
ncbi:MAG: chitinase [Phenylobacterium sp.]|jgi:chitinase